MLEQNSSISIETAEARLKLQKIRETLSNLKGAIQDGNKQTLLDSMSKAKLLLGESESYVNKVFMVNDKVAFMMLRGDILNSIAVWNKNSVKKTSATTIQTTPASSTTPISQKPVENLNPEASGTGYYLTSNYDAKTKLSVYYNGENTGIYLEGGYVNYNNNRVGKVSGSLIMLYDYSIYIGSNAPSKYYDELNGSLISGRVITVKKAASNQQLTTPQSASQQISNNETKILNALSYLNGLKNLDGTYSDHKKFIDGLMTDMVITAEEYEEINGQGLFNREENMLYVKNLLELKLKMIRLS
jgi:hypothetical protein